MNEKKTQYFLFSLTAILSAASFTLTLIGIIQCRFVKFTDDTGAVSLEFGVWKYLHHWLESCETYPQTIDVDASWVAAKVFSGIALAFGGGLVFFDCLFVCAVLAGEYGVAGEIGTDPNHLNTRGLDVIAHFLTGIFTGLILLILNSNVCKDNTLVKGEVTLDFRDGAVCEFSTGAKLIISATTLWILATFLSLQLDIERSWKKVKPLTADYAHPLIDDNGGMI